jgi:predicted phosphate transport protein (TIGR00153 family)
MKETRNILGWLGMAEETVIIREFGLHMDAICTTVGHLAAAVKAYINNDLSAKTIAIENVKNGEHEADLVRLKITRQLYEGLLLPPDREALMKFTKNLDKIADGTNAAGRLLGFIDHRLPDQILKNIAISTDLISKGAAKLREAIQALSKNDGAKAILDCEEIDRIEHEADDQKKILIETIIHAKLDATSVLLTYNLADMLESVTDRIENVAEQVKLLVIKSR